MSVWRHTEECAVHVDKMPHLYYVSKGNLRSNTLGCNRREMICEGNYRTNKSLQMCPRREKKLFSHTKTHTALPRCLLSTVFPSPFLLPASLPLLQLFPLQVCVCVCVKSSNGGLLKCQKWFLPVLATGTHRASSENRQFWQHTCALISVIYENSSFAKC